MVFFLVAFSKKSEKNKIENWIKCFGFNVKCKLKNILRLFQQSSVGYLRLGFVLWTFVWFKWLFYVDSIKCLSFCSFSEIGLSIFGIEMKMKRRKKLIKIFRLRIFSRLTLTPVFVWMNAFGLLIFRQTFFVSVSRFWMKKMVGTEKKCRLDWNTVYVVAESPF